MLKTGEGFIVTAVYRFIDFEFQNAYKPGHLRILWSHHDRCGEYLDFTLPPEWKEAIEDDDGVIHIRAAYTADSYPLQFIKFNSVCTGLTYDAKYCHFTLQISDSNCALHSLASVELNLSDFADKKIQSHEISLEMLAKHDMIIKAVLKLTLRFDLIEISNEILHEISNDNTGEMKLIEEIRLCQDDIIVPGNYDFDLYSNINFIVFIFNPPLPIAQRLNALYPQIRLHFKNSIEMLHVSMDTLEFGEELLEHANPIVKSNSNLAAKLIQRYNVLLENPCIVGVSVRPGGEAATVYSSNSVSDLIQGNFQQVLEQWLENESCNTLSTLNTNFRNKIKLDVQASCLMLKTDVASPEKGYSDLICKQSEAEKLGIEVPHILKAQLDIRQTLFKRGVSGLTGKWWRLRLFDYQKDGKIVYIDTNNNEVKGYIDLFDVIKFEKVPEKQQEKNKPCFNIITLERVYELKAWNVAQMDKWINAATILRTVFLYLKANVP